MDWLAVWHALPESWDACLDPAGEEDLPAESRPWDDFPGATLRTFVCHALSVVSLEEVERAAPVPVFLSGPHHSGPDLHHRTDFGHYNPAFVRWMEGAVPEDGDAITVTRPIYRWFLQPMARSFHLIHQRMEVKPGAVAMALSVYRETINAGAPVTWMGLGDILEARLPCEDQGRYEDEVYPGAVVGFWLRRTMDGSRGAFVSALRKLLRTYDGDWLEPTLLPSRPPPTPLETTTPTGPVAQTVRVGSGEGAWALTHSLGRGWARHLSSGREITLWEREDPDEYEDYGMAARLVSAVGPHVTYEITEGGYSEGTAHPFAYHGYRVVRLGELSEMHPDSGMPEAVPLKWLFHEDNTRCGSGLSGDQGPCDHGIAEERVLRLLVSHPFLKDARQQSMATCIFSEGDLVGTSYGFHQLHGDEVEVHLGLSHGCEVNRGMFNLVKFRMKPPPSPAPGVSPSRTSTLLQDLRDADARGLLGRHLRPSAQWPVDPEMEPEPKLPAQSVVLSSRAPEQIGAESSERCRELGICNPQRARGNHVLCRGTHACRRWGYCQYVAITHHTWRPMGQLKARERAGRLHRGDADLRKTDADLLEHHLLERGHGWMRDREGDRFIALSEWPSDTGLFGLCLPGGDDCAASDACERYGRCVGTAYACEWPADAEGRCDVPMGAEGINPCKTFGKCTNRSGRCYAMSDEDCAGSSVEPDSGSDMCNIYGRCVADKRACVAKRPADCAQSEGCKTDGLCCLDGWRGGCFACTSDQCQASEACEKEGRCRLEGRRCAEENP